MDAVNVVPLARFIVTEVVEFRVSGPLTEVGPVL